MTVLTPASYAATPAQATGADAAQAGVRQWLQQSGFVGMASAHLIGTAVDGGICVVSEFTSANAAQQWFSEGTVGMAEGAQSVDFTFAVGSIPNATGLEVYQHGALAGLNVSFSIGDYAYALGVVPSNESASGSSTGPPQVTQFQVVTAATTWYDRLTALPSAAP